MDTVYLFYLIASAVYSIFLIRIFLSWLVGDFDIDADLDVGDIISFKGFIHFMMGFSGWMSAKGYITNSIEWYDYLIALAIGIIFVIMLYYAYKFTFKLEHKPEILSGKDLIGYPARIYLYTGKKDNKYFYEITVNNGIGTTEVTAVSKKVFYVGQCVSILDYDKGYYLIY